MHNTFSFYLLIHLCEDGNDALIMGLGWMGVFTTWKIYGICMRALASEVMASITSSFKSSLTV